MSDSEVVSGTEPQDMKHLAPEKVLEKLNSLSADDKFGSGSSSGAAAPVPTSSKVNSTVKPSVGR